MHYHRNPIKITKLTRSDRFWTPLNRSSVFGGLTNSGVPVVFPINRQKIQYEFDRDTKHHNRCARKTAERRPRTVAILEKIYKMAWNRLLKALGRLRAIQLICCKVIT